MCLKTKFILVIMAYLLNNFEVKTRCSLIYYRESWKAISFQYLQQNLVQKMKQNGKQGRLYSSV